MTVRFINPKQEDDTVQLSKLNCGDAFKSYGEYFIKSDEFSDENHVTIRCTYVSGSNVGYIAHIDKTAQVTPVTLIVTLES